MYQLAAVGVFFLLSFNSINRGLHSNNANAIQREILIAVETGVYKLELKTILIDDTLNEAQKEDRFGMPLVKSQRLLFYKNGKKIRIHTAPISRVNRSSKEEQKLEPIALPILDICLINSDKGGAFYYVYGAGFCNGIGCLEFTGLYERNGNVIYEGISTNKSAVNKLKIVLEKNKLDLNKNDACKTIFNISKK